MSEQRFGALQDLKGFLDEDVGTEGLLDEDGSDDEEEDSDAEDNHVGLPLIDDSMLDFMPNEDGGFAPTVREPWRSERELKRVKGRAQKGGRKTTKRRR